MTSPLLRLKPPKRPPPPRPDKTPDDFIWVWAGT